MNSFVQYTASRESSNFFQWSRYPTFHQKADLKICVDNEFGNLPRQCFCRCPASLYFLLIMCLGDKGGFFAMTPQSPFEVWVPDVACGGLILTFRLVGLALHTWCVPLVFEPCSLARLIILPVAFQKVVGHGLLELAVNDADLDGAVGGCTLDEARAGERHVVGDLGDLGRCGA